jgi:hypothetical protein
VLLSIFQSNWFNIKSGILFNEKVVYFSINIYKIGTKMDVFPDEHHLSSWAGMSPGNNESAGKKKVPE